MARTLIKEQEVRNTTGALKCIVRIQEDSPPLPNSIPVIAKNPEIEDIKTKLKDAGIAGF